MPDIPERQVKPRKGLFDWLKLPQVGQIKDLDDPAVTLLHAEILRGKPFMRKLYADFYNQFKKAAPQPEKKTLVELGSGGGFLKEIIPNVITSDVLDLPNVDKVFSALDMPFNDGSVDAFFMFDVLHHLPEPRAFFTEAMRCLPAGGKIVMIEPANTPWARFIYKNFHHENFDPGAGWRLEKAGPLSAANGALCWIIFVRDRKVFEKEFPSLKIITVRNHTPLRYLLSGGFTLRQLAPAFAYPIVKVVEYMVSPANDWLGMFMTVEIEKVG
jgi:SAM-dependent methyltransferase